MTGCRQGMKERFPEAEAAAEAFAEENGILR